MKNLKTLIKIHKNNLDNLLKQISILQNNKSILEEDLLKLINEIESESEKFSSTEYGFVLDKYLIDARKKREAYQNNILHISAQIYHAEQALHQEFGEKKKLEIAMQNREKEASELQKADELKEIDDINIMRYKKL